MNKKTKIKTTLDSLFTGGRIKSEDTRIEAAMKPEEPKPASAEKTLDSTSTPNVKQVVSKPVRESKPKDIAKPVDVEKVVETAKPVKAANPAVLVKSTETVLPVDSKTATLQNEDIPKSKISEPIIQPAKPVTIADNPSSSSAKPVGVGSTTASIEIEQHDKIDLDDDEHLVIFSLGKELYGVTIHSVESIIKLQAITEVPRTASYVLGVTNLRGTVVPVLDLRKRFNLQFIDNTVNTRIIIVNAEGSKVGIVVDEVTEVLKVARSSIQPPPPLSTTVESAFINGIAKINDRLVILLDLEKVLASSSRQYNR